MKIETDSIILAALLIPYFEPLLFKEDGFAPVDKVYTIAKIIGLICAVFLFIKYNYSKCKISCCSLAILSFELVLFLSTIFHDGDVVKYFGPAVSVISLTLLTEVYFRRMKIRFIRTARSILFILLIINATLQIKYPTGILPGVNFLGIDNRLVFFYIPLVFFSSIYDYYTHGKTTLFTYVVLALSLWSTISLWAVGGFLGLIVMAVSVTLSDFIPRIKKTTMYQLISIIIGLNLTVVFFQVQKYFEAFIVGILKKDLTLTGRTYLWEWALESIKKYPLFGFGVQSNEFMLSIYYWVVHPHNMFLNYLTTSGVVGFFLYMVILFETAKSSKKIKYDKVQIISNFSVFVILFLSIADTLDCAVFYMIYIVIGLLPNIKEKR